MPNEPLQQPHSEPSPGKSLKPNVQVPQEESWWVEALKTVGLSLVLAFGIRTFVAEARYIPSGSMEPTLQINDRLIVDKVSYYLRQPERGDIIVFNPTDALKQQNFHDAFIKRIVGLPGDQVAIENGQVVVNGQALKEPYVPTGVATTTAACGSGAAVFLNQPMTIPPHQYLVLGDNRNNSYDGRCWGFVDRGDIVGRAVFRFWPFDRTGTIPEAQAPQSSMAGTVVALLADTKAAKNPIQH